MIGMYIFLAIVYVVETILGIQIYKDLSERGKEE